jgi:hypothetical protein
MEFIKLFEAYTKEKWSKTMNHIKKLVEEDAPKEDIINFINSLDDDINKSFNELRIIINRITRGLEKYQLALKKETNFVDIKKRNAGSDWRYTPSTWRAGDTVREYKFKYVYYYGYNIQLKSEILGFVEYNRTRYKECMKKIDENYPNNKELDLIKYLFDRCFEILDWIIEVGNKIYDIVYNNQEEEDKMADIENLNDMDFDNVVIEIKSLNNRIIKRLSNLNLK